MIREKILKRSGPISDNAHNTASGCLSKAFKDSRNPRCPRTNEGLPLPPMFTDASLALACCTCSQRQTMFHGNGPHGGIEGTRVQIVAKTGTADRICVSPYRARGIRFTTRRVPEGTRTSGSPGFYWAGRRAQNFTAATGTFASSSRGSLNVKSDRFTDFGIPFCKIEIDFQEFKIHGRVPASKRVRHPIRILDVANLKLITSMVAAFR